jgi:hypothetical protein
LLDRGTIRNDPANIFISHHLRSGTPAKRPRRRTADAAALAHGIAASTSSSDDPAFLAAVLEAHHAPARLTARLVAAAAEVSSRKTLADRLAAALASQLTLR